MSENFDIRRISQGMKSSDFENMEAESTREKAFKFFGKDTELSAQELADTFKAIDKNGDGRISEEEISEYVNGNTNIKAEERTEYITFLKEMAKKNSEMANNNENTATMKYTVQLNEGYTDLIKRILVHQGVENPTEEQIEAAKKQFEADNQGGVRERNGVKYLLAGMVYNVRANTSFGSAESNKVFDRNNAQEQMDAWARAVGRRKSGAILDPQKTVKTANIDYSKITDETTGVYQSSKVRETIEKALEVLKNINDSSKVKSIKTTKTTNGYTTTVALNDGNKVVVDYDNDMNIRFVHVNTDATGKTDILFESNGTIRYNGNNDKEYDLTLENVFKFDEIKAMLPEGQRTLKKSEAKKIDNIKKMDDAANSHSPKLRRTNAYEKGWYCESSGKPPKHYKWNGSSFVLVPNVTYVDENGGFKRQNYSWSVMSGAAEGWYESGKAHGRLNSDGSFTRYNNVVSVSKNGQIKINLNGKEITLRGTDASRLGWFYDEAGKCHYKLGSDGNWTAYKNVKRVDKNGKTYT